MSTQRQQLEAFRRGERVKNDSTLLTFPRTPDKCVHENERTVVCADERDVVECAYCGRQRETACNFDEEYS